MKVDAALPWRWFAAVEYVRRLNRQMHRGWPELSEATEIEEGGIPLTIRRLHSDVVDQAGHATREFTSALLQRADHVGQFEGSPIPVWTESSRFAVVAIDFVIFVVRLN